MAKQPPQKAPTRKHLARAEREARLQRIILIVTGVVLALVIGFIVLGFVLENVIQPQQEIATVDDTTISTAEFQKRVRYQRSQLIDQYANTVLSLQQFGTDPNLISFLSNSLSQIEIQLENATFLGQDVLDQLIDEELIRQEADSRGVSISEEVVDKALEEAFGFFPDGLSEPTASPEPEPTSTLSALQKTLVTAIPTADESSIPTAVPTTTPSEDSEAESIPTTTPYTREAYQQQLQSVVENFADIGFKEDDLRNLIAIQLLQQELFETVTADTPSSEEQVWARHILVDDEETALDILESLDEGEDWSDLAAELSTDASNAARGGDLGWFGRGRMVVEFEDSAFVLEIGEISDPIETQFGWHIIQVLGHEERQVGESDYTQIRQQAFQEWVDDLRGESVIVIINNWESRVPTDPTIPIEMRLTAQQILSGALQPAEQPPVDQPPVDQTP